MDCAGNPVFTTHGKENALKDTMTIVGGIGGLILLFLILTNAEAFGKITQSISGSSVSLIKTLQGH